MPNEPAGTVITRKKQELGGRLVILAHHYQSDAIVKYADFIGDSLELARRVSQIKTAELIVFCGVAFMAETAVILAPDKQVFIPDPAAGCPLADTARIEDLEKAWELIQGPGTVIPVTYVNSSAAVKAFCGRNNGTVCTSGNARKVMAWAFSRGERVLFLPDRNLGYNTAREIGIPEDEIGVWDPAGPEPAALARAKLIVWNGGCPVHASTFGAADVELARRAYPGIKVIVHPESDPETVKASDASGSTARIITYVEGLGLGEKVAIGTETTMVRRLAESYHAIVRVMELKESFCADMAKITVEKLAACLSDLSDARRVRVPETTIREARLALDRMLEIQP